MIGCEKKCKFALMKLLTLILSLLLSLFAGGRANSVSELQPDGSQCSISERSSSEKTVDHSLNRDICITAAQGYSFTGNNSTNSVSVRTTNAGRRTSPQTKSTFRVVKSGKVIDNNNIHPFLTPSFITLSGTRTSERYLYSICRLRL